MISIFNLKYHTLLFLLLVQFWHSQMSFLCFVQPPSETIYNTCENENAKEGGKEYVFTKDKYSTAIYIYYSCDGKKKTFYKSPAHNDHCANGYQSNNYGDCGNRTSNDTNFLLIFSKSYRMFNKTIFIYWKAHHLFTSHHSQSSIILKTGQFYMIIFYLYSLPIDVL